MYQPRQIKIKSILLSFAQQELLKQTMKSEQANHILPSYNWEMLSRQQSNFTKVKGS